MKLRNTGSATALGLTATLTTSSGAVTVANGTNIRFGDVAGNSTACGITQASGLWPGLCAASSGNYPTVTASAGIGLGTQVPFTLVVKDKFGNTFTLNFTLTTG